MILFEEVMVCVLCVCGNQVEQGKGPCLPIVRTQQSYLDTRVETLNTYCISALNLTPFKEISLKA